MNFIEELMKHNVPSISPGVGMHLVAIADALATIPDKSVELKFYEEALRVITSIAVLHQGVIIQRLERLVEADKAET